MKKAYTLEEKDRKVIHLQLTSGSTATSPKHYYGKMASRNKAKFWQQKYIKPQQNSLVQFFAGGFSILKFCDRSQQWNHFNQGMFFPVSGTCEIIAYWQHDCLISFNSKFSLSKAFMKILKITRVFPLRNKNFLIVRGKPTPIADLWTVLKFQ